MNDTRRKQGSLLYDEDRNRIDIRFRLNDYYGDLHCGETMDVLIDDVFRIIVPLDDNYSFDAGANKAQINHASFGINFGINKTQQKIIALMVEKPEITAGQIAELIGVTKRQIELSISKLKSLGIIERKGARKNGHWMYPLFEVSLRSRYE